MPQSERVCPWWMGYLLASPIRRLYEKPEPIVEPYVKPGMTVLEIGPGMGYFTIPMARMVGEHGRIICADIQEKMLKSLVRRAIRAGVSDRVITRLATSGSFGIDDYVGKIDCVILIAVVHEIPDQRLLFSQIYRAMKPGAQMLIAEPAGHVTPEKFSQILEIAKSTGLVEVSKPEIKRYISIVLGK